MLFIFVILVGHSNHRKPAAGNETRKFRLTGLGFRAPYIRLSQNLTDTCCQLSGRLAQEWMYAKILLYCQWQGNASCYPLIRDRCTRAT